MTEEKCFQKTEVFQISTDYYILKVYMAESYSMRHGTQWHKDYFKIKFMFVLLDVKLFSNVLFGMFAGYISKGRMFRLQVTKRKSFFGLGMLLI